MNIKINDVNRDIDEENATVKNQDELDEIVRPRTIAAHEYRSRIKKELEITGKKRKRKQSKEWVISKPNIIRDSWPMILSKKFQRLSKELR